MFWYRCAIFKFAHLANLLKLVAVRTSSNYLFSVLLSVMTMSPKEWPCLETGGCLVLILTGKRMWDQSSVLTSVSCSPLRIRGSGAFFPEKGEEKMIKSIRFRQLLSWNQCKSCHWFVGVFCVVWVFLVFFDSSRVRLKLILKNCNKFVLQDKGSQ